MITIDTTAGCPSSEYSPEFVQGMYNRMATSYFKYGALAEVYPDKVDAIASLRKRLERYEQTGNTEWLLDVSNFAMIEFMRPRAAGAHFRATDSQESPGRKWFGEVDTSTRGNSPKSWKD